MNPALRSIVALALAVSSLAAAPHPSLPGPTVPDGLGVNIHFTDPIEGEMELLAAAGFRWVRMDLGWGNIERERGVYDFSAFDRLTAHLRKHGIKALFILDYSNRLYETDSSVRTEEGRQAFARWAAATAKRYQGRGYIWEVWNEPNISFWKPKPDAGDYSALANAAAAAIHKAAPGEAVIGPATSGFDFLFQEACFKNGVLNEWDAVSVHPYRQTGPESVVAEYAQLRQTIQRFAPKGREIPVISGEWGYSAAWKSHDEETQGQMLAREFLTNLSQGIPLSIWYDWRDDGTDPKEPEHHFGTVGLPQKVDGKNTFRIKPAYRAAKTLTSMLSGHHFVRRLALGTSDDWALLFSNNRELVVACWTTSGGTSRISLPVADAKCEVRDPVTGKAPPVFVKDGSIEVPLGAEPLYLRVDRIAGQLMELPAPPAFTCDLVRAPGGVFLGLVENPTGESFAGTIRLTGVGEKKPLSLAEGETAKQVRFENHDATEAGLEVWKGEHRVMTVPARRYPLGDGGLLARCVARGDGDPKITSIQTIAPARDFTPLPGFEAPVSELTCRFEPGWRFACFDPQGDRTVPGSPKAFDIWVFGDASGVGLRARVKDANGRVWQLDGATVTWRGWRHVRLNLTSTTAHWGGQGEEIVRYPLQWETPILVDNLSRQALQSRLLVTAPTTVE